MCKNNPSFLAQLPLWVLWNETANKSSFAFESHIPKTWSNERKWNQNTERQTTSTISYSNTQSKRATQHETNGESTSCGQTRHLCSKISRTYHQIWNIQHKRRANEFCVCCVQLAAAICVVAVSNWIRSGVARLSLLGTCPQGIFVFRAEISTLAYTFCEALYRCSQCKTNSLLCAAFAKE